MTNPSQKVPIRQIPTGVPGLDVVLGGGLPAFSINIIAGAPGCGKTTLGQQIIFNNSKPDRKTLYFAAFSEPVIKMLRYQQQFDFFDAETADASIVFHDLGRAAYSEGLKRALDLIRQKVDEVSPDFVVIDSFKALEEFSWRDADYNIRAFIHDLALSLASWEITCFLVGEYTMQEVLAAPEFSVADGIFWLEQEARQNAITRKLQVIKCRGQESLPGRHTFRISSSGITVFPRTVPIPKRVESTHHSERAAFGIAGLDEMMRGGVPAGETCLITGSSGTGKTLLSLHFVVEGAKHGEPTVMVTFEEHPREHEKKARAFGWDLRDLENRGLLRMMYLRPIDLSVDEVLHRLHELTNEIAARRVVINSVSGFELSLSPSDQEDFREALYRLLATLTGEEVTTLLTMEVPDIVGGSGVSTQGISFLADNLVMLRFVEIESQLRKALAVVKMRSSDHAKDLRQYQIGKSGIVVEQTFAQYSGILSGIPTLRTVIGPQPFTSGLSDQEEALMHVLIAVPDSSVEQLAASMSMGLKEAQALLDKLVDTGYVFQSTRGGRSTYRVALVAPPRPAT